MWCWWVWYHLLFFPPWSARLAHVAVKLAQAFHVQAALFLILGSRVTCSYYVSGVGR